MQLSPEFDYLVNGQVMLHTSNKGDIAVLIELSILHYQPILSAHGSCLDRYDNILLQCLRQPGSKP